MADSNIEWTDKVWNPVRGCTRVSGGCGNCYAERTAMRFSGFGQPYEGLVQLTNGHPQWTGKIHLAEDKLDEPLHWKKPRRVFVNSMSDLFHEDVPDEFIARVFGIMSLCPEHTFQILTKRPERMVSLIDAGIDGGFSCDVNEHWYSDVRRCDVVRWDWPLPNVWLGVSVEDQKTADERIPLLLQTPAAVRWVSYEPALGPVDFQQINWANVGRGIDVLRMGTWTHNLGFVQHSDMPHLDWVVCGGESGPGARPMHPDWARSVRDQCVAAGVPFFFKQWGEWQNGSVIGDNSRSRIVLRDGGVLRGIKEASYEQQRDHVWNSLNPTMMGRVGKKAAGRLLDGREWNEYPEIHRNCDATH